MYQLLDHLRGLGVVLHRHSGNRPMPVHISDEQLVLGALGIDAKVLEDERREILREWTHG
jgi:hypothetical protein